MPPSPPKKAKEEDASKKPTKADTKIKTLSGDVAELSEEDQALQKEMELLVERVRDPVKELRKAALEKMVEEVRTSTSSMTSVPKPLKFLRPHFPALKESYTLAKPDETKTLLADVLSLLVRAAAAPCRPPRPARRRPPTAPASPRAQAMTMGEEGQRESLNYKLLGTTEDLGGWGHEYVRHLAGEIGDEYNERLGAADEGGKPAAELLPLILEKMLPFFMAHNTESEAIDLLMEVGRLDELLPHIDATNCDRVVMYLVQVASYVPEPEDGEVLLIAVKCRRKLGKAPEALRLALRLGDMALVEEILTSCDDELAQKQMAYAAPPPPVCPPPSSRRRAPPLPPDAPSRSPLPGTCWRGWGCAPRRRRTWRA